VIWLFGHSFDTGIRPSRTVYWGRKAMADSKENRTVLSDLIRANPADGSAPWPQEKPVLLAGSRVPLSHALGVQPRVIAVCRALERGIGTTDEAGVEGCNQKFQVLEVLDGRSAANEVRIAYTLFHLPTCGFCERRIEKGDTVLWFAQPGDKPDQWKGIKALLDTPENRKLVREAAQPLKLPGSDLTDIRPIVKAQGVVALMEAMEEPRVEELEGDARMVSAQPFKVVEAFDKIHGSLPAYRVGYRYLSTIEAPISKGQRVIWAFTYLGGQPESRVWRNKAYVDTPENRETLLKIMSDPPESPIGHLPAAQPPLPLPGSEVGLGEALKMPSRVVALCQAVEDGLGITDRAGIGHMWQKFKILQMLDGRTDASQVSISYTWYQVDQQRQLRKGDQVIWIAAPGDKPDQWRGVKAMLDTPENRKAVIAKADGEPGKSPSDKALTACLLKIKAMLPDGWSVVAEKDVIMVRRDEKVEADYMSPVGMSPERISTSDVIQIRVGPRISAELYAQMAAENMKVRQELLAKHPNYDPVDNPISRRLPHVLPTHFDGQHSFWISSKLLNGGFIEFKSKEVFDECSRAYAGVEGLFYRHEEAKAGAAKDRLLLGVIALRNAEELVAAIQKRLPANWQVVTQRVVDWSAGGAAKPRGRGVEIVIQRQGFQPLDLKYGRGGQVVLALLERGYTAPNPETARAAQAGNAQYLGPWRYPGVFGMVSGGNDWATARADIQAAMKASKLSQPPSAGSIRVSEVQGFATKLSGIMPANWEVASIEHRETGGPG